MTTLPKFAAAGVEVSEPDCELEGKISMALMTGTFAFARCANRMVTLPPVTETCADFTKAWSRPA